MLKSVIIFPDKNGEGVCGEFFKGLLATIKYINPKPVLLPVLNTPDSKTLVPEYERAKEIAEIDKFECAPIILTSNPGLNSALIAGYKEAIKQYPDYAIIRMDTDEHPVGYIEKLLKEVENNNGMVIGDLKFKVDNTLVKGSADYFVNLFLFPLLYGQYTDGRLPLTCAHGFQAFAPHICETILNNAEKITNQVKETFIDCEWGFDGAMALAAHHLTNNKAIGDVRIIEVPAEKERNRVEEKVVDQLIWAIRICCASRKIMN